MFASTKQALPAALLVLLLGLQSRMAYSEPGFELDTEVDILGDIPVSHTATRLSQSVHDSPVSLTIIGREMIDAYGADELVDVLRLVPGFQVIHPKGFRASTAYHGIGGEFAGRMQVQIDGRAVYSPILGHVEWTEIPLEAEDIERIEVIRGPNAASYGANSFTAIINIITRHTADTIGNYVKLTRGSRDTNRVLLRHGGHSERSDYRLSLAYRNDDGFDDQRFPDDKRINSLNYRLDYQPNLDNQFEFQFGYRDTAHQDGDNNDPQTNPATTVDGRTHFQLLRWRHQLSEKENFSLQFYHNYQRIDYVYDTDLVENLLGMAVTDLLDITGQRARIDNSRLLHRYDLEYQHNLEVDDKLRLVWGASARFDRSGSAGYLDTPSNHDYIDNHVYRLFAHGEWKPAPAWTINAGAMLENNDVTGTDFSPRLALNYHLSPRHSFRASVSRAYRTPSVLETNADRIARAYDSMGNPVDIDQIIITDREIEPERLTSLELAYIGHYPRYGINIDAKLFYDRLDNFINDVYDHRYTDPLSALLNPIVGDALAPLNSDAVLLNDNTGNVTLKGFEAQIGYQLSGSTRLHAGHTILYVDGKVLNEINNDFLGDQRFLDLQETAPKSITTLQLIHDLQPDIRTSISYHHYGAYEFEAGDPTEPFSILNARLAKTFRVGSSSGQLAISFQNLFGDYFDFDKEQVFKNRLFLSVEQIFN